MDTSSLLQAAQALRHAGWIFGALALFATVARAESRAPGRPVESPGRSMVITRFGIVATSQALASRAGAQILEAGGNAVDAAIAANAALGVVEPMSDGIGGDLFAIVYEARTGKLHGLNSSGWAPAGMTVDFVRGRGLQRMPEDGILTVTVPGCVAGWDALHRRLGKLPLRTVLASAIHYAEDGFPVTERIAAAWKSAERLPAVDPVFQRTYLPGGRAPEVGEIFRDPDLAGSLRRIAERGRDGFYRGPTARALVELSRRLGGAMEAADLAEFQPDWVEPISTTYRGWKIFELPPNGQGIAALMMLNLMEQFPLSEYGHNSARALHTMIEAKKLAYADVLRYVADPRFSDVPVAGMLSKDHAARRAKEIDPARAMSAAVPSAAADLKAKRAGDTIYLSAIDREGNIVSLIQSVYSGFGAKLVAPGTGFALQNRGALFSLDPAHPNVLAPHKRPLHTIIPGFMQKGETRIGFGIMGGWNQAQAHAQFVSNVVDFGMNIQAALESPRFTKHTFEGVDVQIEPRIPEATRTELARLGHQLQVLDETFSQTVGGGQAVLSNGQGVNFGASDPRKDGAADPQGAPLSGKRRVPAGRAAGRKE
jgi:gamma-glutamyltranspeptidase/glutathione hydrolase